MPTCFRFLTVVAGARGSVWRGLRAERQFLVNPTPREMSVSIPSDKNFIKK